MSNPNKDIPQEWIRKYVDKLLALAKCLDMGSAMQTMALMRAEHAMDLVKAYRDAETTLRCPECGYTAEDAAIHLDHHLCKGTIPT